MKVFLDDARQPYPGWVLVKWPKEAIELLEGGGVTEISLDHDLGSLDSRKTGMEVLRWIEEQVVTANFRPPIIWIHTSNPSAREQMERAVEAIKRLDEGNR
jgi:hypothetical protein